ncbi:uncharacterized protein Dvar_41890 [Desulfosarcina variabilis str. Montpellier]
MILCVFVISRLRNAQFHPRTLKKIPAPKTQKRIWCDSSKHNPISNFAWVSIKNNDLI